MVKTLLWLQAYCAIKPNWDPLPCPWNCDGLSCERCHDAQQGRQNCTTAEDRLEGCVGVVQEWHRRQQLYEVWKHENVCFVCCGKIKLISYIVFRTYGHACLTEAPSGTLEQSSTPNSTFPKSPCLARLNSVSTMLPT